VQEVIANNIDKASKQKLAAEPIPKAAALHK
jgi:hypothetical protein